jgi:hypothetical protein
LSLNSIFIQPSISVVVRRRTRVWLFSRIHDILTAIEMARNAIIMSKKHITTWFNWGLNSFILLWRVQREVDKHFSKIHYLSIVTVQLLQMAYAHVISFQLNQIH